MSDDAPRWASFSSAELGCAPVGEASRQTTQTRPDPRPLPIGSERFTNTTGVDSIYRKSV